MRILFAHGDAAEVERCLRELRRAHWEFGADVVLTPEQFAEHLKSTRYDVATALS